MSAPSFPAIISELQQHLLGIDLDHMARSVGLVKRTARKMPPMALLSVFTLLGAYPSATYSTCASIMAMIFQSPISRQAIWRRTENAMVMFLRKVLEHLFCQAVKKAVPTDAGLFVVFNRVLIQDSTCLKMPHRLADVYPGGGNQHAKNSTATLKIQTIIDLKTDQFLALDLSPFRRTDQAAAWDILTVVKPRDLVIRDLGYFGLKPFRQLMNASAFFLSRANLATIFQWPDGPEFSLVKTLRRQKSLDCMVRVGREEKLLLRLVAIPIPRRVADERRRKLRAHQINFSGKPPTPEHMILQGWEIFLTNVPPEVWSPEQVSVAYGFRWRIEIIFKSWKSMFQINTVSPTASCHQVNATIYGKLIFILCFQLFFWAPIRRYNMNGEPSLLKAAKVWRENFLIILLQPERMRHIIANFAAYAANFQYDKRRRLNFEQILTLWSC